ncbi:Transcriptional activator spt7 [Borealophlyctis nickersoniae]|nr:Transcriptional activator spt7 [Borealophlyctis nickersoniae]
MPFAGDVMVHPEGDDHDGIGTVSFAKVAAFRIRSMIFEQFIPKLYSHGTDCFSAVVDPDEADDLGTYFLPGFTNDVANKASSLKQANGRPDANEDDDYDEEDTEDKQPKTMNGEAEPINPEKKEDDPSELDLEPETVPLDDMYYSLEYDTEAIDHFNMIEDRLRQEEAEAHTSEPTEAASPTDFGGEVHSSLKYLYMALNKEADPSTLKDLKGLMSEIRPSKSKWASNERIGQEQLYTACEIVLNKLKNTTNHSKPFLRPVSKKEAPDYYDIIKNPMDLGTVTKKLKDLQYNSKAEFAADLYLIWSNCETYNARTHPIRHMGSALKRKTTDLLKKVPDITIVKVREDEWDSEDGNVLEYFHWTPLSDSLLTGPSSEKEKELKSSGVDSGGPSGTTNADSQASNPPLVPSISKLEEDMSDALKTISERRPSTSQTPPAECPTDNGGRDDMVDEGALQIRKWKEATMQYRYDRCREREEQSALRFGDRKALVRKAEDMGDYQECSSEYLKRNKRRRTELAHGVTSGTTDKQKIDEMELKRMAFLPEITHPVASFPALPSPTFSVANKEVDAKELFDETRLKALAEGMPSLSQHPEIADKKKTRIGMQLHRTIKELKRVKEVHAKILAQEAGAPDESPLVPPKSPHPPIPVRRDLPPLTVNAASAASVLKQVSSIHLAQSGFDAATDSGLSTLADVAAQYFMNLGKTLRAYLDKYGRTLSAEDILLHVLKENGVDNVGQLGSFIRHDVDRYGDKMHDLRRKLDVAYKNSLREPTDEDDVEIEESREEIMSGHFFEDLGFDVLNLKDCGIDIGGVPAELWNRKAEKPIRARVRRTIRPAVAEEVEAPAVAPEVVTPSFLRWRPVDPSKQIGLLRPFYEKKVAEGNMVEDEDQVPKVKSAKLKALMKTAQMGRKRAAPGGAGDEPSRKKRKMPDPAIKAAKEAEKQKKAAERAEKQRQIAEKKANRLNAKGRKGGGGQAPRASSPVPAP